MLLNSDVGYMNVEGLLLEVERLRRAAIVRGHAQVREDAVESARGTNTILELPYHGEFSCTKIRSGNDKRPPSSHINATLIQMLDLSLRSREGERDKGVLVGRGDAGKRTFQ